MEQYRTAIIGTAGTVTTLTLVQINVIVGIIAGLLTCVYVIQGIVIRHKHRDEKKDE